MTKKPASFIQNISPVRFYIGLLALVIAFNTVHLVSGALKIRRERTQKPFYFSGFQFLGLEETLRGETHVGYITDKDLDSKQHAAQFAQAQYLLSPVILDLNNTDHTYILFDFTSEQKAMQKMKSAGAAPLKKNGNLILAVKVK